MRLLGVCRKNGRFSCALSALAWQPGARPPPEEYHQPDEEHHDEDQQAEERDDHHVAAAEERDDHHGGVAEDGCQEEQQDAQRADDAVPRPSLLSPYTSSAPHSSAPSLCRLPLS
jgi:hypothetical protein